MSGVRIDIGPYAHPLPDTVVWAGAAGTDWFSAANWNPGRTPDSLQVAVIPGTGIAPNQPVISGDTAYCAGVITHQNAVLQVGQGLVMRVVPGD